MSVFTRVAWFGGSLLVGLGLLTCGSGDFGPAAAQSAPVNRTQFQQQQLKKHHHKKHHKRNGNRSNGQLSQRERQELLQAEALINRALSGR